MFVLGRADTGVQIWGSNRLVARGHRNALKDCLHFNKDPRHKVISTIQSSGTILKLRLHCIAGNGLSICLRCDNLSVQIQYFQLCLSISLRRSSSTTTVTIAWTLTMAPAVNTPRLWRWRRQSLRHWPPSGKWRNHKKSASVPVFCHDVLPCTRTHKTRLNTLSVWSLPCVY